MRRLVLLVAVLTLAGGPWASASTDTAAVVDVACTSNVDGSPPGLTDIYHPCTSTDPTLTSGTRHVTPSPVGSCSPEANGNTGKDFIVWSNGQVSTWEYTRDMKPVNGSLRIHQEGKITAGLFAGDRAVEDLTVVLPGAYLHAGAGQSPDECEAAEGGAKEPLVPGRYVATGTLQISRG